MSAIRYTYSAFVQGVMPSEARPEFDTLEGLTAAIVVGQERLGGDARSTVGTAIDATPMLRILYSRIGDPQVGPSSAFSPNVPSITAYGAITVDRGGGEKKQVTFRRTGGMCAQCEGRGEARDLDPDVVVDRTRSLRDGAILAPVHDTSGYVESGYFDADKKVADYTGQEWEDLWSRPATKLERAIGGTTTYEGLSTRIHRVWMGERTPKQKAIVEFLERAVTDQPCPACAGTGLNEGARSSLIGGIDIARACALQVSELRDWLDDLGGSASDTVGLAGVQPLVANLSALLGSMVNIGLAYLTLERAAATLSGGEAQRVKMVRHLGSALSDVTGSCGGEITYVGDVAGLRASDTATGRCLDARVALKDDVRIPTGHVSIADASLHNLQSVTVDVPLGVVCVVSGVAGSGKSSLIHGCMPARDDLVVVDRKRTS